MKIAICQINPTVGAINQNKKNILDSYSRALDSKADIVVFPELALIGYPPQDLLLRDRFIKNANNALTDAQDLSSQLAASTDKSHPKRIACTKNEIDSF